MTADRVTEPQRRSPLHGWQRALAALPPSVRVRERPFLTQLSVRLPDAELLLALAGYALPAGPGRAARTGSTELLWLGPDEWLLVADQQSDGERAALLAALQPAARELGGAVTDVSAQRTTLTVAGPAAAQLLAMGCAIDLHPSAAPAGTCVQTLLAQAGVIIVVHGRQEFQLLVRASFAEYLAGWLVDASAGLSDPVS